ncbi:hypothetical protein F5Y04DRAFT_260506 [Hypomontagnella monticulosa]|nr:hypothetical protein F5Y04DRAFT_260506 [Hypomontagnella monticulosa]
MASLSLRLQLRQTLGLSWFTPHKFTHQFTHRRCLNTSLTKPSTPESRPGRRRPKSASQRKPQQRYDIRSICREHQIFMSNGLHTLKGVKIRPNPCSLAFLVSERHCVSKPYMKYFDGVEHPFAKSMVNIYIAQKKQPLWLTTYSAGAAAFPCRVATRRIRHALRDALAAHGYDRYGTRITADSSSVIADLYGSVSVYCRNPEAACNIKFADLLEQVKQIVSAIEPLLGRDEKGTLISTGASF